MRFCLVERGLLQRYARMLQVKGFIGRYITYTGPDFKEGLSLTVHDEITRWRKYAFGCSELVFNPLKQWWYRCPTRA